MAVKFRDYYETLGVPRDAAPDDIRKAFRKLARKYHPDVADDKVAAEEKFKEINEAYEVLGDVDKRKKYDALGENWRHGGDFNPPGGSGGFGGFGGGQGGDGYDFHFDGTGFSDFFENIFGSRGGRGGGGGFRAGGGSQRRDGGNIEAEILVSLEEVMHGSERSLSFRQPGGTTSNARIRIPKGITEGQRIRCAGLGSPGLNGGKSGDLFLHVHLERHPFFRPDGHDLYLELRLAPWEAVLGATVPVRNLHGGTVRIKVPPHTDSGTEFRLASKGLPKGKTDNFGDLYAVADIVTPETISEAEHALWQALADGSSFEPRA